MARSRQRSRRSVQTEAIQDGSAEMRSHGERVKRGKKKQQRRCVDFDDVAPETLAHISVSGGMTTEIVEGEYAKLNVMLTLPSLPDDDSIEATKQAASEQIQTWLREEYNLAVEFFEDEDEE